MLGQTLSAGCLVSVTGGNRRRVSAAIVIVIVVAAIVLLVLIAVVGRMARQRRLRGRRQKAGEFRKQAAQRERIAEDARAAAHEQAARAERTRAEANEKEAASRRTEIRAEERAGEAEIKTQSAREYHDRARRIDPDESDSGEDKGLALDDGVDSAPRSR